MAPTEHPLSVRRLPPTGLSRLAYSRTPFASEAIRAQSEGPETLHSRDTYSRFEAKACQNVMSHGKGLWERALLWGLQEPPMARGLWEGPVSWGLWELPMAWVLQDTPIAWGLPQGPIAWGYASRPWHGAYTRPMARACCELPMARGLQQRAPARCGMELPMARPRRKAHGKGASAPLTVSEGASKFRHQIQNFFKFGPQIRNHSTSLYLHSTYAISPKPPIRGRQRSTSPLTLPYSTYYVLCRY